jgi:hypothetical protein
MWRTCMPSEEYICFNCHLHRSPREHISLLFNELKLLVDLGCQFIRLQTIRRGNSHLGRPLID